TRRGAGAARMTGWLPDPFAFDALARPAWLAVGLALAALGLALAARRTPDALPWPAWPEAEAAGARRDRTRWLAGAARLAALGALAVAIAGPVREHRAPPPPGEGLDLVLVLDASDSMRALDAEVGGQWRTRFELAREVEARFARQRAAEGGGVGRGVFGEAACTLGPLTGDGALLEAALARAGPGMAGGATALGDALALAVKRVAPRAEGGRARGPRAGRLVVLLTDGRSNTGAVPPDVAAALAAARGVRVHTVGIRTTGEVAMSVPDRVG